MGRPAVYLLIHLSSMITVSIGDDIQYGALLLVGNKRGSYLRHIKNKRDAKSLLSVFEYYSLYGSFAITLASSLCIARASLPVMPSPTLKQSAFLRA